MQHTKENINHIFWQWQLSDEPGLEHLILEKQEKRIRANGLIIGIDNAHPFRLRYQIQCDTGYHFRQAELMVEGEGQIERGVRLVRDTTGVWSNGEGQEFPAFNGCTDIDIQVSPFTNTLPIRRLQTGTGNSTIIQVVYIAVPTLELSVERQRYTRLVEDETTQKYRFESLTTGFTTEIETDTEGVVINYPGIWQRVW